MNIQDFITYLAQGREIEFCLNGKNYFLQPDYKNGQGYVLYYCESTDNSKAIFSGTSDDILKYRFENKICLQNDFDLFEFSFIL